MTQKQIDLLLENNLVKFDGEGYETRNDDSNFWKKAEERNAEGDGETMTELEEAGYDFIAEGAYFEKNEIEN